MYESCEYYKVNNTINKFHLARDKRSPITSQTSGTTHASLLPHGIGDLSQHRRIRCRHVGIEWAWPGCCATNVLNSHPAHRKANDSEMNAKFTKTKLYATKKPKPDRSMMLLRPTGIVYSVRLELKRWNFGSKTGAKMEHVFPADYTVKH